MNTQQIKYIAYYRVSTEDQGKSGLGLESQKRIVTNFIQFSGGELLGEYQDIESAKSDGRSGLMKAISACSTTGAVLVVKQLDRISRAGAGIMDTLDALGVHYFEVGGEHDSPFVKGVKLLIAKDERDRISKRTSDALTSIKETIKSDGSYTSRAGNVIMSLGRPENLTDDARKRGREKQRQAALQNESNKSAGAYIKLRFEAGVSFYQITKELRENGFKTSRGNYFSQVTTKRMYNRFKNN
jgi:DNA invertase Pin-like site-specific DNA recombinase